MSITLDRDINIKQETTVQVRVRFAAIYRVVWNAFSEEADITVGFWERASDAAAKDAPVKSIRRTFQNIRTVAELDGLHDTINERLDDILG